MDRNGFRVRNTFKFYIYTESEVTGYYNHVYIENHFSAQM